MMLSSCASSLGRLSIRFHKALPTAVAVLQPSRSLHSTPLNEAARKGTREKARKKKVKVEIKKVGFIPHNQRNKDRFVSYLQYFPHQNLYQICDTDDIYVQAKSSTEGQTH